MTLRELIVDVDHDEVYRLINEKDNQDRTENGPTIKQTVKAYQSVIDELLLKPKTKKYHMSILVKEAQDWFDKHKYPDVCLLNHRYVEPPKGLKAWGGKNPPKGSFNINLNKYNRTFAMGFISWSKIIDTPVVNEANFSNEKVLAEILWEITFYGWSEKQTESKVNEIKGQIDKSLKQIKEGKCVTLPPSKKGGYKVVIPDCVSQQIIDIANKK